MKGSTIKRQQFLSLDSQSISVHMLRLVEHYRQPEFRIVYIYMDAKNTVQTAVPIQPDFAQVA